MRRIALLVCASMIASTLAAEDGADHPIVGRYGGSSISHQEASVFDTYEILVGGGNTETLQGAVWMTLYRAPDDANTFAVYATYLDFLRQQGFEILFNCEPGGCAGGLLGDVYNLAPFADDGNVAFSAPLTNANNSQTCFVSAMRERDGSTIYVSIAIASGWYDYPQYRLDVIEIGDNPAEIVSQPASGDEDGADHPLVGRYNQSGISHQETTQFGRYEILTGPETTETVQGSVTMTLYYAPENASSFGVYSTYRDFLVRQGFEILYGCEPGVCEGNLLGTVYDLAPFADNGNFGHPAPFTNGSYAKSYFLSAKREAGDSQVYVSAAIAAGWAEYPQYKLDVIEIGTNAGAIVSTGNAQGTVADSEGSQATPEAPEAVVEPVVGETQSIGTAQPASAFRFLEGIGSFRVWGGMAGYMFLDPTFAGEYVISESLGTSVVSAASGFKNLRGPFAEIAWLPNENTGLTIGGSYVMTDAGFEAGGTYYSTDAEMLVITGGVLARAVGRSFPASVSIGFGGGVALVDLQTQTEFDTGTGIYLRAQDELGAFSCSATMSIPLLPFLSFTSGVRYLFIPFDTLMFEHDGGSEYSVTYVEGNLGSLGIRLGLSLEL